MLSIFYGKMPEAIFNTAVYFKNVYEDMPKMIITEDSNSGYQFFQAVAAKSGIVCKSAGGKSNIFLEAFRELSKNPSTLLFVLADSAAFGSEIEKLTRLTEENPWLILCLPESFEWLILKSGIIKDTELKEILAFPEKYIDSQTYFSWERFFTALLIEKTNKTYLPELFKTYTEYSLFA